MPSISINLSNEELKAIEKRAKKSYMGTKELIEDITRRSMISYKNKGFAGEAKVDDKIVTLFSREKRGRKGKNLKKAAENSKFYTSRV